MRRWPVALRGCLVGAMCAAGAFATATTAHGLQVRGATPLGDSVLVRLPDTDLPTLLTALAGYLPKPVVSAGLPQVAVSLETPHPVTRQALVGLLRSLVEAHGLLFTEDSASYRITLPPTASPSEAANRTAGTAAGGASQLEVIRLRHAQAGEVAATLNLLYGRGEFSQGGGLSTPTLSEGLRRPSEAVLAGVRGPAAHQASSGGIMVIPDDRTNSLLIRAGAPELALLQQAIEALDIRPLQVLIEVLIVEARHDRSFSLGADLFLPPQGIGDGSIAAETAGGGLGDLVIRLMNLGKADVDGVIRAAASRGDVEIISRPILIASNNTEARILVGSQRPFVSVSRSLPTDIPSRDQVVEYKDVGTRLVVRPTINHDGYVLLTVQQEVNQATSEVQFDAPVIATREALTQVLVRDSQTVVLGGLRDHQHDQVQRGVPLLSAIPILGGLFGSADRRTSRTELFMFITPRIIRTDEDVDRLTGRHLPQEGVGF